MTNRNTILCLITLALVWGLSFPLTKLGLHYTLPLDYTFLRLLIGTLTAFILVILLKRKLIVPGLRDLPVVLSVGIFQMGLLLTLSSKGLSVLEAGKSTLLIYTTPIWVVLFSLLFGEKPNYHSFLSVILGLIGIFILINPLHINWHNQNVVKGNLNLIVAAFIWALGILCARYLKWYHEALELWPWQLLVGTLCPLLLSILEHSPLLPQHLNHTLIISLLYVGIIATGLGYLIMVLISKHLSPIVTSLSSLSVPFVSILFSIVILGEKVTLPLALSLFFISMGLLTLALANKNN